MVRSAGAIAAKAVNNAQLQTVNDDFLPKAWHNLRADQFFPDRFGVQGHNGREFYAWARQGIDDAASCDDPALEPELTDAVLAPVAYDGPRHFGPGDDGTPPGVTQDLDTEMLAFAAVVEAVALAVVGVGGMLIVRGRRGRAGFGRRAGNS